MEIVTKIAPLYSELIKIKFHGFVQEDDFVRICNSLDIGQWYTNAYNKTAEKKNPNDFFGSFLNIFDNSSFLARLLNDLYREELARFPYLVSNLLIGFFRHSNYIQGISNLLKDLEGLGLSTEDKSMLVTAFNVLDNNILLKVKLLIDNLVGRSTNGKWDDGQYQELRIFLLKQPSVRKLLPDYVISSATLDEFWQYIKPSVPTYEGRRLFIRDSFADLVALLESSNTIIADSIEINELYVLEVWTKASQRMKVDPEGAITSARTLLETVCKYILDESQVAYNDDVDLPTLYKTTSRTLNLSPDQHTEQIFKQITQGVTSIISGLGSIRNKISDAHAINQRRMRPSPRHAALAVNLAGAVSQFLLQCFEAKSIKNNE